MKRVLIVDDDRATSAGMADVVEEWGYEPEVADNVKAGWNAVSKLVPDVAIVDLKLPLEKLHLFDAASGDAVAWSTSEAAA